jgi:Tfp pilus assembly protein PilF
VPENAEINFALGNLWYAKGDSLRTKLYYRRTLELEPRHSSAYSNLGVIALEEKRPEIAENFLQRALAIEPDDYKTMYLLARARYERNDLPGARQAINEALKYRPNQSEFLELLSRIDAAERAK